MKAILCLIIDRSGSMTGRESDVIGGVNRFIDDQKKEPGEAYLTLVQFDHEYEQVYHGMPIPYAPAFNKYAPRGSTALLDAVGRTIAGLEQTAKATNADKVIVCIITDGQENASREFSRDQIRELITAKERGGKWAFIYLGADPRTFTDASALGVSTHNTATFSNTAVGTRAMYSTVSASVSGMRSGAAANANLGGRIPDAPTPAPDWTAPKGAGAS